MNKKKVIIGTPHVWDAPYKVGSHQYAKCFSDDKWDVMYISTPISPFHLLYYLFSKQRGKVVLPPRWNSFIKGGKQIANIWTYVPFGLLPIANLPFFRSKWVIEHAGDFLIPGLRKKLATKGVTEVDTIWLDSPVFGYLLDMIPHKKSVLRIADELSGFPELGKNIIEVEKDLIAKVDLVVVTANALERKAKRAGAKNTLLLSNGVDFDHFRQNSHSEPEDLMKISHPRVVYVGAIERWFNDKWVEIAALQNKDLSFVIIGNYENGTYPSLEKLPNVYFLGKREYEDVPAYLHYCDVGMIPFKKLDFIDSVNPIKLYEYMASGLPVVSTKWKTLEEIGSPAFLAETELDFIHGLNKELKNKDKHKRQFVEFARENSWARRFELVKKYLT